MIRTQLLKWGLKAIGGLLANVALLTVWVDGAGIHPAVAVILNWVIISVAGYGVANYWIFPDGVTPSTLRGHARQYAGMQLATAGGKGANYAVYLVLLPVTDYRVAWVVGAGVTFSLTFALNKWWWDGRGSAVAKSV